MATVTGFTAERMLAIEQNTIVSARREGSDLILTTFGGVEINLGSVNGRGVQSTTVGYQLSTSAADTSIGPWFTEIPQLLPGYYLWTKITMTYTDDTSTPMYTVARIGQDGNAGSPPRTPNNLTLVSNTGFFDNTGAVALIVLSWDPVDMGLDAEGLEIASYEVFGGGSRFISAVTEPVIGLTVPSGKVDQYQVRALSTTGLYGDLTVPIEVTAATPASTTRQPSPPTLSSAMSTVVAKWDGTYLSGGNDGAHTVIVELQNGSNWVQQGPALTSAGSVSFNAVVGSTVSVRLRAYDQLGRLTGTSVEATVTVVGIEIPDLDQAVNDMLADISDAADAAQLAANGKNTNWYQNDPPPLTGNKLHDCWFDLNDANRMYRWNGTAWTSTQFGNNAFSAIDAGKISTGTLNALRIAARSITVDKLNVGDFTNITVDPLIESAVDINWTGTNHVRSTVSGSTRALATIGNSAAGACHVESMRFYTVDPNATYYLGAELYRTTVGSLSLGLQFYDKSKVAIGTPGYCVIDHTTNNWTFRGGLISVPATAVFAKIVGDSVGATSAGNTRWTGFIFRRANTGELIVDGTILARHVEMDTAFADKFWANEGNFAKINVDMLAPNVGDTLTLTANSRIDFIVSENGSRDLITSNLDQSLTELQNTVGDVSSVANEAKTLSETAQTIGEDADSKAVALEKELAKHKTTFSVTSEGALISSQDGSTSLELTSTGIAIRQGITAVSSWDSGRLIVNEAVMTKTTIGNHVIEKYGSGRTIFRPL